MQDLISKVLKTHLSYIHNVYFFQRKEYRELYAIKGTIPLSIFHGAALCIDIYLSTSYISEVLYPRSLFINTSLQL